eukprot:Awhi_evm1s5315
MIKKVKSFSLVVGSVLSLIASSRTTGMVLDSGYNLTTTVPIVDLQIVPHMIRQVNIGGKDVTDNLIRLLKNRGYEFEFTTLVERQHRYLPSSPSLCELQKLPNIKDLDDELFLCTEGLFAPSLFENDDIKTCDGIHTMLFNSLMNCGIEYQEELCQNIVLSGGNTLLQGFGQRLEKELLSLAPKVRIIAPSSRMFLSWTGGAALVNQSKIDIIPWMNVEEIYNINWPR